MNKKDPLIMVHVHFGPDKREHIEVQCAQHGPAERWHKGRDGPKLAWAVLQTIEQIRERGCQHEVEAMIDFMADRDVLFEVMPDDPTTLHGAATAIRSVDDCDLCDPRWMVVRQGLEGQDPMFVVLHSCPSGMQMIDFRPEKYKH